jgi:Ca2+-binding EF-hand superfamily protein
MKLKSARPLLFAVTVLLVPAMSFAAKGDKKRNKSAHRHGNEQARALGMYDRNHNQEIDAEELSRMQGAFAALKGLDKNTDGTIDATEVESVKLPAGHRGGDRNSVMRKADANGNHKIDADEVEGLQKALAGNRMMKRIDTNGDGKINEDELQGMNKRMGHGSKRGRSAAKTETSASAGTSTSATVTPTTPSTPAAVETKPAAETKTEKAPEGGVPSDPFLPKPKTE